MAQQSSGVSATKTWKPSTSLLRSGSFLACVVKLDYGLGTVTSKKRKHLEFVNKISNKKKKKVVDFLEYVIIMLVEGKKGMGFLFFLLRIQ